MAQIWHAFRQGYFIPPPTMTEQNCPDVSGRVFFLTGGTAGIGYELCKMLYAANGIVYLTSRTLSTAHSAAQKIRDSHPESKGRVEGLQLDLTDLRTVKPCAEEFLKRENDLDVLFNNAGVQMKPLEGRTVQGYEVRVGVNCLGHFILTQLLVPTIKATAAKRRREGYPEGSVRILFAGSIVIDASSPPGGVEYDNDGSPKFHATTASNYGQSKAGNLFLTKWFRDELKYDGILCVCFNPGNVNDRYTVRRNFVCNDFTALLLEWFFLHPLIKGAYTELWTALTPELTLEDPCIYTAPWGRKSWNRPDVESALEDGSPGKFVEWCWREAKPYL